MAKAKKNKPTVLLDLRKELLIQVDGEEEKSHIIQWDILKDIGDATQNLILKLAKYSLEDQTLPPEALKLQFIGFHEGSAVPDFRLPPAPNLLFNSDKSYAELNQKFSSVVHNISEGNFQRIADSYNEPSVKNEMIEAVYDFSNAGGLKPVRIVRRLLKPVGDRKFTPIVIVRPMGGKVRELLRVKQPKEVVIASAPPEEGVAKVFIKVGKSGRHINKIAYLHSEKEAILSFNYDSIETDKRIYILNTMVSFTITEETKKSVSIENRLLDIYACGKNKEEAKADLFDQFDYKFRRLHDFDDDKLSRHLLAAKKYFDLIVGDIKDK